MNFIKYEVWEDYWCFKPSNQLDISILEKLNFTSWKKNDKIAIIDFKIKKPSRQT